MKNTLGDAVPGLVWGAGLILLALGARYAQQHDHIDHDTMLRLVIGANGLMIAYFGNRAPKMVAPSACARQVARFAGWSLVLSGLAYTGLWIFAPISLAVTLGTIVVAGGMIATLGYGLQLRARVQSGK